MTKPLLASDDLTDSDDDDNQDYYDGDNDGDESSNDVEEEVCDSKVVNMTNDNIKDTCYSKLDPLELRFGSDGEEHQHGATPKKDVPKDYVSALTPTKTQKDNQSQKPTLTESLRVKKGKLIRLKTTTRKAKTRTKTHHHLRVNYSNL